MKSDLLSEHQDLLLILQMTFDKMSMFRVHEVGSEFVKF
jgi:hypothetical protein